LLWVHRNPLNRNWVYWAIFCTWYFIYLDSFARIFFISAFWCVRLIRHRTLLRLRVLSVEVSIIITITIRTTESSHETIKMILNASNSFSHFWRKNGRQELENLKLIVVRQYFQSTLTLGRYNELSRNTIKLKIFTNRFFVSPQK